jgi:hypothetical protein
VGDFAEFIGPTYQAASPIADAERLVNWYPERISGGAKGQNQVYYRPVPGTTPFTTLRDSPVRGLYSLNGRTFAVAGGNFFEVLSNGGARQFGTVVNASSPATMSSNGDGGFQVFIVSGGSGYIFNLTNNFFDQIDPLTTAFPSIAVMGAFCDGYFLVLEAHSGKFYISTLEDGSDWAALDVAQVSESSNRISSLLVDHRQVLLFGQLTTEVWYNSGYANFPFQPNQGAFMEQGINAPYSAHQIADTVAWLGANQHGGGVAYRLASGGPSRISTHAIESTWSTYGALTNAIGWGYQEEGHSFSVFYFPTGPQSGDHTSWVYDHSTELWHERGLWDTNAIHYVPAAGRCHTFGFGKHLVGDRSSGTIYVQSSRLFSDYVNPSVFGS